MEPDGGLRAWCSTPSEPSSAGACCVCKFNASQGANPKADSPRSGPAPAMNACQLNSVAESVAGATGRYRVSPLSPPLASCDPPDAPVAVMTKRVPKRTRRAHGAHPSAPPHSRPPWCAGGNPSHSGVPPPQRPRPLFWVEERAYLNGIWPLVTCSPCARLAAALTKINPTATARRRGGIPQAPVDSLARAPRSGALSMCGPGVASYGAPVRRASSLPARTTRQHRASDYDGGELHHAGGTPSSTAAAATQALGTRP